MVDQQGTEWGTQTTAIMPPIPIYSKSPINAAKADGVTPQTAAVEEQNPSDLKPAPISTEDQPQQYPAARPGAVPSLPAPTGAVQAQRYAPVQPTPTQPLGDQGPPPPQPGAVPIAPGAKSTLPPPPKAGEAYHPPVQTSAPQPAASVPYPPQMGMAAPTVASSQRGTSTAFVSQFSRPVEVGGGLEHPPGYHQNASASGFNSYQRPAHSAAERDGREEQRATFDDDGEGTMWDSAKKFAQAAGDKLSAAEHEVWRRINKE